ncbi:MAG: tRNA (N6-threonylcarbamoyladenosine(37)-N6)-methyltransferase TrmO, partial [Anaerolineales bacterium]|nr:tRNA (N6-threonylcarbamoyladenosine(37)-N6)-methyltransferase TrmO [Anaerolineales bacterium]
SEVTYHLHPVGYVRHTDGGYQLHILEPYRPALKQLDQFIYAMVFWWAHEHDNPKDRNVMQAELPYAPGEVAGVFACRAECRPNPIALTTSFIIDIDEEAGNVQLAWIDAHDGTPVLDLKTYVPISDRIRDVGVVPWFEGLPEWMEDAAVFFAESDFLGD